jgi:hypothetical protein
MLINDTSTVPVLKAFLQRQVIHNKHWGEYRYDAAVERNQTLHTVRQLAVWFRDEFPYYYDGCLHCLNTQHNAYLGTVFPTKEEQRYQASRTELYTCSECNTTSRFARYNDVKKILDTRRGRCGEYSVLMMLFLTSLDYTARWVVDREDHVSTNSLSTRCLVAALSTLLRVCESISNYSLL